MYLLSEATRWSWGNPGGLIQHSATWHRWKLSGNQISSFLDGSTSMFSCWIIFKCDRLPCCNTAKLLTIFSYNPTGLSASPSFACWCLWAICGIVRPPLGLYWCLQGYIKYHQPALLTDTTTATTFIHIYTSGTSCQPLLPRHSLLRTSRHVVAYAKGTRICQ